MHTEYTTLQLVLKLSDTSGYLMRWRSWLAGFYFEPKYKRLQKSQSADALSCLLTHSKNVLGGNGDEAITSDLISLPDHHEYLEVLDEEQELE